MTDHTPDTGEVRAAYTRAMRNAFIASTAEHIAEFDRWLADHDRQVKADALREARVRIEWTEYVPNDGTYEYTSSGDCDGSRVFYQRRKPRYVGDYHPWEPTDRESWEAAVEAADV